MITLAPSSMKPAVRLHFLANVEPTYRRVITAKGFDAGDAILRAAIREQVGSTVKRLHRNGAIENTGAGRGSKWKLASKV
jgi:hypothetical protein